MARHAKRAPKAPPGFAIDLHVHTGRYSQCAELLDPYEIERVALAGGLSGVVLTEHDMFWQDEEISLLRASSRQIRIYRGIEVSAQGCHLVVIGIEDGGLLHRGASLEHVAGVAHAAGAAVILAHPYRDADPESLPLDLVDAVEIGSTSFTRHESERARHLAARLGKPIVAASDAHSLSRIGWAWTVFPASPENGSELAAMILSGAGRPLVAHPLPA